MQNPNRICYLAHPEQDYLDVFIFQGLCEVLGEKNVIVYPFKKTYIGEVDKTYILPDGKTGFTAPGAYNIARKLEKWSFNEICDRMDEFSFILLSSPRSYAVGALRDIIVKFGKVPKPLVFMDGEDGGGIRWDLIRSFQPQVVFKREMVHEIEDIYSLPFSSIVIHLPYYEELLKQEKALNVFALCGNTHPLRPQIIKFLIEQNIPNSYIGIDNGILPWQDDRRFEIPPLKSYEEYLKSMASAKINIVIRGHGRDTVRMWEIGAFKTLMLIKDPGIIIPHPYIDKEHCVYFNELSDLKEKVDYYLSHDEERDAIAERGFQHTHKYHSNAKRAEYLLNIVKERTGCALI